MNSWKWSTGEAYYKSARPEQPTTEDSSTNAQQTLEYDSKQNAINQSLDDDHFDTAMFSSNNNNNNNNNNSAFDNMSSTAENRRETLDNKMSDRQMIPQRGVNPFLQQTSYVNDIVTRDMFLKPLNTTKEKLKVIPEDDRE